MKQVKKSVLLGYTPHEMYRLVSAVEDYPKFLPWCESATVVERDQRGVTARLGLHYMGVRHAFTTRNDETPGEAIVVKLVDGPFSRLDGSWLFRALGPQALACKVEFELCYAFASKALETVVSPVFDRVANTFVDAFVKRAEVVHGPR